MSPSTAGLAVSVLSVFVYCITAYFIWKQVCLLRLQNQIDSLTSQNSIWNSSRMCSLRLGWANDELRSRLSEGDRSLDYLEPILEFLEEFAVFHKMNVLNDNL